MLSAIPADHHAEQVETVTQAAVSAWHQANLSGRHDVPLSVVAALGLVHRDDASDPAAGIAGRIRGLTPPQFLGLARDLLRSVGRHWPGMVPAGYPLLRWLFDRDHQPDPAMVEAAKQVADAALAAGQLEVTGSTEKRRAVDLLGPVYTALKPAGARASHGHFYTPPDVADLLATITVNPDARAFYNPAIGTGGLLRAAAAALRHTGRDPAGIHWYGADTDETALACAAINTIGWGLGPHVYLTVTDTIADPDWHRRARAQHDETTDLAQRVAADRRMIRALDDLTRPYDPTSGNR